ncbi:hypothetical protein AMATHDRAFT_147139 [Amanita thiersii Skay4041]|uniref:RNA polymerase II subunit A C-terminal domain phosphatase n=1 Tax=Amanita thiersii Skay4041 TaxID=703135 RepID=A0A2A9NK18_9AGAR|nr:hypothetical protein AMATHDRAFT_147139 [Amanita thiersii Skay4041]
MSSAPTNLHLPLHFPFPIKILSLDVNVNQHISRGTRLLSYSFIYRSNTLGGLQETRFGTWDSSIEGKLDAWKIKSGDVISLQAAKELPVVIIIEPCKHGMQLGGLCVVCGKDMTNIDYTGFSDASRASIQMTHSAFGPTVSLEEAQRIERETADHLLRSRKLSLIVDLDQTIVHATVDPTVGEWISEGEVWEQWRAKKSSSNNRDGSDDDSDDSSSDTSECPNPNWEALKDVKKFRLGPESFGPPAWRGKGKCKAVENEGCMYYIKPRPGWTEFFEDAAKKYEMHVYTMGTRAYAEQVCSAIDPDGKLFGGRLLSRDESGSLTQKSLRRLFPCDTSMVVIIDDRADVWEWSPNLIKVIPYDFFVGIGDINSTFLPKLEPLTAGSPTRPPPGAFVPIIMKPPSPPIASPPDSVESTSTETDPAQAATNAILKRNNMALEIQLEERPLAKKQDELLRAAEGLGLASSSQVSNTPTPGETNTSTDIQQPSEEEDRKQGRERKALLKNEDHELQRIAKLLDEVHRRFFVAYDARIKDSNHHHKRRPIAHDVTKIIPQIRSEILAGVHILFSSVIPLDTTPETTEIWRMAHMFGAECSTELTSEVTHVVAAKRGTVKVEHARKQGGIKIVWLAWFTDSVALWRRQEENPYLLDELPASASSVTAPTSSPATSSSQLVSSEPDPDTDELDLDPGEPPGRLELGEIDWGDINDEVEAAMNESDDPGEEMELRRSEMGSEDDWTDDSISGGKATPTLKRKRFGSLTPSEAGRWRRANGDTRTDDEDGLKPPLAKRKKQERTKFSKLKEAFTADDLEQQQDVETEEKTGRVSFVVTTPSGGEEERSEYGDDEEEDDFLARELEEEWG